MLPKQFSSEVGTARVLQFQSRSPVTEALGHVDAFCSGPKPKPNLVSLSWAARQGDQRSCEGRNLRGKDSAKPPALPAGRAGSGCVCWSVAAAVLAGQETAPHLSPSRVSIARDFSDVPCQQSFLIKILNQASDHQFQTRSWQP